MIWAILLEFIILFFFSTWQKGLLSGSDSKAEQGIPEEQLPEIIEERDLDQTLDQMAFVEHEIDADS